MQLMDSEFWARAHGGATHLPLALIVGSVAMDGLGWVWPQHPRARDLHAAGYWMMLLGALGAVAAVWSGLVMTHGALLGGGALRMHHLFVWPAFAMSIALATWRALVRDRAPRSVFGWYLGLAIITSALILGAGYWGGELLLG
jgi:uncharacterized membrane protein